MWGLGALVLLLSVLGITSQDSNALIGVFIFLIAGVISTMFIYKKFHKITMFMLVGFL